ncbi:aldehyde dehydrogenase family protein [Deinococcus depolymerans]|uniref:Aldehyde dehydrogenase n=1 Tax=Deinococcus depolymerans TaxID=392408 RepID=A0ABN1C5L2_9DEIO
MTVNLTDPTPQDLRALFDLQRAARWDIARSTPKDRVRTLRRLRAAIIARRDDLTRAIHADFGKARLESEVTEIHHVIAEIDHATRHLRRWTAPHPVPGTPELLGSRSWVQSEPLGQVLILSPWNYPFGLLMAPLVAAIAAGNVVTLRPSEKVPHTARALQELIGAVFHPAHAALVTGDVPVADALLDLPFDHVFFTGSTAVGRKVATRAAAHLASVTLELGGKSPTLLLPDADPTLAGQRTGWAKFLNAGQTCVAPDHAWVPPELETPFVDAARTYLRGAYGEGHAAQRSPDYARLIDRPALDRLLGLIDDARTHGATLATGGQTDPADRFLAPTILTGVTPDMAIMQEELFGPVLPVLRARPDEAMTWIRERPKPLALYVYSRSGAAARDVLSRTSAGTSVINHGFIHMIHPHLPFGGTGQSGTGQYHGHSGFRTLSHERAVLHQRRWSPTDLLRPPYARPGVQRLWQARRRLDDRR